MATPSSTHLALCLALLATSSHAQQPGAARVEPLRELAPDRVQHLRARLDRGAEGCFDESAWRERLTQPDLALRELAFDELVLELPRCAEGQRVLQAWALNAAPELAWSARLALRELRRVPETGWIRVDELGEPLVTRAPIQSDEPDDSTRLRRFPGLPDGLFAYGGGLGLHRPRSFSLPLAQCELRDGRAYCVRMGGEGVAVEIIDTSAGEESRRAFTGESLEQILAAHPELARDVPELQSWVASRDAAGELSLRWTPSRVRFLLDPQGAQGMPQALVIRGELVLGGGVLGVECEPVTAARAKELGLEPPRGLVIERTWPGSIATRIELQRGDVLLELNGKSLATSADLRAAIHAVGADGRIVVRLVDSEGQPRTLTWDPGDE